MTISVSQPWVAVLCASGIAYWVQNLANLVAWIIVTAAVS